MLIPILADGSLWDELSAFAAIAAALVAVAALAVTQLWTNFHKKLDVTMHFQEAYAKLEKEKTDVRSVPDADAWFQRYWHLQIREYEYWLHGYIRDEIYIYWMICNKADYNRPRAFPIYDSNVPPQATPYSYAKGWETVKDGVIFEQHPYSFKQFIERMLAHKQDDTFAQCILETRNDLFSWSARLDRLTESLTCNDPRKLFRLRQRECCPPCNANAERAHVSTDA